MRCSILFVLLLIQACACAAPVDLPPTGVLLTWSLTPPKTGQSERPCLSVTTPDRRVRLRVAQGRCRIVVSWADGQTRTGPVWSVPAQEEGMPWTFSLRWIGRTATLVGNGVVLGQLADLDYAGGELSMEDLCLEEEVRVQPLDRLVFEDDFMREGTSLGEWKPLSGQWELSSAAHPSLSASPFRLSAEAEETGLIQAGYGFWSDYALQASVRLEEAAGAVGLVFGWGQDRAGQGDAFHLLRWAGGDAERDPGTLTLYRVRGETWTQLDRLEGAMPVGQWMALGVGFRGKEIQCGVNGNPCLEAEDPSLTGGKIGLRIEGGRALFDDVFLRSASWDAEEPFADLTRRSGPTIPSAFASDPTMKGWTRDDEDWTPGLEKAEVLDHTFYRAPVDWFAGTGTWRIARRWICQPEFSWMRGDPDGDPLAVLWHDWIFQGDVCLEAFCANAMTARTLPHYDWGVNRCLSICGDGKNPLSGYAFLWGGPDFPSRLTRLGRVVAETDQLLDPLVREDYQKLAATLHHSWTGLSLRKKGSLVTAEMDGEVLLRFEDPEPLDRGRVAVWSSRFGLLLARVRVSYSDAERPGFAELLDWRRKPILPPRPAVLEDVPFDPLKREVLSFELPSDNPRTPHLVLETNHGTFGARLPGGEELPPHWIRIEASAERGAAWNAMSLSLGPQLSRCMPWVKDWEVRSVRLEDWNSRHPLLPWLGAMPGDPKQEPRRVKWGREKMDAEGESQGLREPRLRMSPDPRWRGYGSSRPILFFRNYGERHGASPFLCFEEEEERGPFLRAVSQEIGGFFGLDTGLSLFDPAKYRWIAFESRSQPHGTMSLVVWGDGYREEAAFTGSEHDTPPMGQVEGAARDGAWRECVFHLGPALASARQLERPPLVERITFGETGYWSHVRGDRFDVDHFELLSEIQAGTPVEILPEEGGGVGYESSLRGSERGIDREIRVPEGQSFLLEDLTPGAYVLDVWAIDQRGERGPFARTRLFVVEPIPDSSPPEIADLSPSPWFRSGRVQIDWRLEDEGAGVDFSSVELTVGEATHTLASNDLEIDETTGNCSWRPKLGARPWPEGQVACRLCCADLAGNRTEKDWKWTFTSLLDDEPPTVEAVSLRPEPCLAWHDFEEGPEGWESFARFVVDWGDTRGPAGDPALALVQMRKGDRVTSARMGFGPFSAEEWPLLSLDLCPNKTTGFTVLARVKNTDLELKQETRLEQGAWRHVTVDLEQGLRGAGAEASDLPVEFLLLKFDEMCVAGVDNACLHKRVAQTVDVRWKTPEDPSGLDLYRVALTERSVAPEDGWTELGDNYLQVQLQAVRSVYLHIQARDRAGNLSVPSTFLLQAGASD